MKRLRATNNETAEREDEARLAVEAAEATVQQFEGMREMAQRAARLDGHPLADRRRGAGKTRRRRRARHAAKLRRHERPEHRAFRVADPKDLQVEIDVNESDLPKISLNQQCRVTPEAFPDKHYGGFVAEMAPEANRQKGTLQIKVQIENPGPLPHAGTEREGGVSEARRRAS